MLTKSRLLTALSHRRPGYLGWRIGVGSAALVCWLAVFCGGLLIDTTQYRAHLAPRQFAKLAQDEAAAIPKYEGSSLTAFLLSALWFTPTNLAFLALLSGLLGGCVSNILVADPVKSQRIDPQRYSYLAEMPWSAMIRSFIVYLCVIAGLTSQWMTLLRIPHSRSTCGWQERSRSWHCWSDTIRVVSSIGWV